MGLCINENLSVAEQLNAAKIVVDKLFNNTIQPIRLSQSFQWKDLKNFMRIALESDINEENAHYIADVTNEYLIADSNYGNIRKFCHELHEADDSDDIGNKVVAEWVIYNCPLPSPLELAESIKAAWITFRDGYSMVQALSNITLEFEPILSKSSDYNEIDETMKMIKMSSLFSY